MKNVLVNDEQVAAIAAQMKGYFDMWLAEAQASSPAETDVKDNEDRIEKLIHAMEKRSNELRGEMAAHFALAEKRIDELRDGMNAHFALAEKRYELVEKRIDELRGEMAAHFALAEKRYELAEKRFDELRDGINTRFKQQFSFVTAAFVVLGLLVTVFGVLGTLGWKYFE